VDYGCGLIASRSDLIRTAGKKAGRLRLG